MSGRNWMFSAAAAVTIAGALAVAAYTTVEAQGRGGRRGGGPGFGGPPPMGGRGMMGGGPMGGGPMGGPLFDLRALDLSEAQHGQIRQLMDQHREQTRELHEKAMAARRALGDAIGADAFDESAIRARSAEAAAIDADLAVAQARLRQSVVQVLTPEQQQKARELRERRQAQMENRLQAHRDRLQRLGARIRER